MNGRKRRQPVDIQYMSQDEIDEAIERIVRKKGWYVPAIHERYLEEYIV